MERRKMCKLKVMKKKMFMRNARDCFISIDNPHPPLPPNHCMRRSFVYDIFILSALFVNFLVHRNAHFFFLFIR